VMRRPYRIQFAATCIFCYGGKKVQVFATLASGSEMIAPGCSKIPDNPAKFSGNILRIKLLHGLRLRPGVPASPL